MSDLVGNPEDRFSRVAALIIQVFSVNNNELVDSQQKHYKFLDGMY